MKLKYETCGDRVLEAWPEWTEAHHFVVAAQDDGGYAIMQFFEAGEPLTLRVEHRASHETDEQHWQRSCMLLHCEAITDWQKHVEQVDRDNRWEAVRMAFSEEVENLSVMTQQLSPADAAPPTKAEIAWLQKALDKLSEVSSIVDDINEGDYR